MPVHREPTRGTFGSMTASSKLVVAAAAVSLAIASRAAIASAQQGGASPAVSTSAPPAAPASRAAWRGGWQEATAGSEREDYLRTLQVAGLAPRAMVSLRAWSPLELARLAPADSIVHPWRAQLARPVQPGGRPWLVMLRPETRSIYNSSFPFGLDDGAVWAGRGLTQVVSAGVQGGWGPLTVQLAPIAFWSQNADVEIANNGKSGLERFGDVIRGIDRPQRFGDASYSRVDPGQSTIRLDMFGITAGFSTANEVWGPGVTHPLVLSANAAGVPRVFAGTSAPADIWLGRLHGRIMIGRLDSSPYAPQEKDSIHALTRMMLGMVASFSPRFAPNLEVGLTRVFHKPWPEGGPTLGDASVLFENFLKAREGGAAYDSARAPQNQVASTFFRFNMPPVAELYGELYREDHSVDLRDLAVEPEHDAGYMLGLRRVWRGAEGRRLTALRLEVVNGRPSRLMRARPQAHLYTHTPLTSGHTQYGQVLGSEALMGGGGGILALDRYTERGRVSLGYQRVARNWINAAPGTETFANRGEDVIHALGGEVTRFRGPLEWRAGAQLLMNLNRDFTRDVAGVQVTAGVRWAP